MLEVRSVNVCSHPVDLALIWAGLNEGFAWYRAVGPPPIIVIVYCRRVMFRVKLTCGLSLDLATRRGPFHLAVNITCCGNHRPGTRALATYIYIYIPSLPHRTPRFMYVSETMESWSTPLHSPSKVYTTYTLPCPRDLVQYPHWRTVCEHDIDIPIAIAIATFSFSFSFSFTCYGARLKVRNRVLRAQTRLMSKVKPITTPRISKGPIEEFRLPRTRVDIQPRSVLEFERLTPLDEVPYAGLLSVGARVHILDPLEGGVIVPRISSVQTVVRGVVLSIECQVMVPGDDDLERCVDGQDKFQCALVFVQRARHGQVPRVD